MLRTLALKELPRKIFENLKEPREALLLNQLEPRFLFHQHQENSITFPAQVNQELVFFARNLLENEWRKFEPVRELHKFSVFSEPTVTMQ